MSKLESYRSPRVSSELPDCSMPLTFDSYNTCSLGCIYCVPSDTKILMAEGREKVISRVKEGDTVLNVNEETGKYGVSKVVKTMKRVEKDKLIKIITTNGKKLFLTKEHPVLTKRGWVAAKDLNKTDEVAT